MEVFIVVSLQHPWDYVAQSLCAWGIWESDSKGWFSLRENLIIINTHAEHKIYVKYKGKA